MASTIKRKVITIAFMAIGAVVVAKGHTEEAAIFYGIAIAYWLASGLWARLNPSRLRAPPSPSSRRQPAPAHVEIAAHAGRAGRSDGAAGAAARLDPQWRKWLRDSSGET